MQQTSQRTAQHERTRVLEEIQNRSVPISHDFASERLIEDYLREDEMPKLGTIIAINVVTFLVLGLLWLYASEWLQGIHCCAF